MSGIASRTVDWWPVHLYVESKLCHAVTQFPTAGTLPWIELDDDDERKLAAVLDFGRQRALDLDTRQEALAQASRDVAEAVDCQSIARGVLRQEWRRTAGVYIPKEVA